MKTIEELITLYTNAAVNLRKVAALSLGQAGGESVYAVSKAKAMVYESVVDDLKALGKGN